MEHNNSKEIKEANLELTLHYFLKEKDRHSMSAEVFNECERNMLLAIKELSKYIDESIKIEVFAREEGGVVGVYTLGSASIILAKLIPSFLKYWLRPKLGKAEENVQITNDVKNKIEIVENLKKGNFTEEQFDYIASNDSNLRKLKSIFFATAIKEENIEKIQTVSINCNNFNQDIIEVEYTEFDKNIEIVEQKPEKYTTRTTVYIISPVLVKIDRSRQKWTGLYKDNKIEFNIIDKEFLKDVENKEINFRNGTKIDCDLQIINNKKVKTMYGIKEEIDDFSYTVSAVYSWEDDDHFKYETKRYKRIKGSKNQISMFPDLE